MAKNKKNRGSGSKFVPVKIKDHHDKKGGHPHVILGDVRDNHVSVGLTRKPKKGKNSPNYKLEKNPLGGSDTSYMKRQGTVAPKTEYYNPRTGKMTPTDHAQATKYGEKARQKHFDKKKKP